jgi:hypothetical protein
LTISLVQQAKHRNAFCHGGADICAGHGNNFVFCRKSLARFRGRKRFIL